MKVEIGTIDWELLIDQKQELIEKMKEGVLSKKINGIINIINKIQEPLARTEGSAAK